MPRKKSRLLYGLQPSRRAVIFAVVGILSIFLVLNYSGVAFTSIQNEPLEMVLDAQIKVTANDVSFTWNRGDAIPTEFKQKALNGTLNIVITIVDTNIDVLNLTLQVTGPVPGVYDLVETETGKWTYDLNTTTFTNGTYVLRIEGAIDTADLYASPTLGGGISTITYTAFNVIWAGGKGTVEEIFGYPWYYVVGGIVLVLLLVTGGKKRQQSQQIIVLRE